MVRAGGSGVDPASLLETSHSRLPLQVEGVVASDPEPAGTTTQLRLSVDRVLRDGVWTDAGGDVLVTLRESAQLVAQRDVPYFRYGDRLLLEGLSSHHPSSTTSTTPPIWPARASGR